MKKGLLVLLVIFSFVIFAVSAGLACESITSFSQSSVFRGQAGGSACESITPAQTGPKVHSLQEFLDSVRVYYTGEDLGVTSDLAGSDNPIEIIVEAPFEVKIGTFFDNVLLTAELFRSFHGYIENKEKNEAHTVLNFSIEISDKGFTLPEDDFWSGKFSGLQRKLVEAALNRKSVKIKGYIEGWGYHTNDKDKFFYNICFRLRVTEIQELPDAGE